MYSLDRDFYSPGKIVIVEKKKAKIINETSSTIDIVFQENGKYHGNVLLNVDKNDAESLYKRKISENKK